MRSNQLCHFEKKISEINNHLSHATFIFKQFGLDNEKMIKKKGKQLTTEVYKENEYSPQFNVRLENIQDQTSETFNYILDTIFVFTNTQFEVYLKDIFLFLKNNSQFSVGEPPESNVYETIFNSLGIDQETDLDNLLVSTYEYFRYRRNAVMHRDRNKRFHGAVEDLIKGKGNDQLRKRQLNGIELNFHWKKHREQLKTDGQKGYTIKYFDFAKREITNFSITDLFDVLNFYRLYTSKIDNLIMEKIEVKYLIDYLYECYKGFYGIDAIDESIFYNRLKKINRLELNLNLKNIEIEQLYKRHVA